MNQLARLRREREKEEIQRRILESARELFAEEGYDAVTMRQIADRIEYTPTAIYFHFRGKEALFQRLCAEDFGRLEGRFKVLARVADPVERIRMLARAYVGFALEHPNHYRLIYGAAAPRSADKLGSDGEVTPAGACDRGIYDALLRTITEALEAGRLRRRVDDPQLAAQTLWAGLHGVASLEIAKGSDPNIGWRSATARTEAMIEALLAAMVRTAL